MNNVASSSELCIMAVLMAVIVNDKLFKYFAWYSGDRAWGSRGVFYFLKILCFFQRVNIYHAGHESIYSQVYIMGIGTGKWHSGVEKNKRFQVWKKKREKKYEFGLKK